MWRDRPYYFQSRHAAFSLAPRPYNPHALVHRTARVSRDAQITHRAGGTKEEPRVRAKDGERLRQTSIHLPVELHKRVRKYAFDQEVTLSTVMVDAIEAWLDAREG